MKILILNGNPDVQNRSFDEQLAKLSEILERTHPVSLKKLRELTIKHCIGCYSCWLKTPGVCFFKDDCAPVLREYINSDFVLYASPVVLEYISSRLKAAIDRLILPSALPFLTMRDNLIQHPLRYQKMPATALILGKTKDYSPTDPEVIDSMFRRNRTRRFRFIKVLEDNVKEIADEINNN